MTFLVLSRGDLFSLDRPSGVLVLVAGIFPKSQGVNGWGAADLSLMNDRKKNSMDYPMLLDFSN